MRTKKGWHVKALRPEELCAGPEEYYTQQEIERYAKSNAMRKAQERIAARIVTLMQIEPPLKVLDVGCGAGYSAEYMQSIGFNVTALDILEKMVKIAKEKGLNAIQGDARALHRYFAKETFDAIVSVSALQWISTARKDVKAFCSGAYYVLKHRGVIGIQFYPKSESELLDFAGILSRKFSIRVIVDNPENPKKRTSYVIGRKEL